MTTLAGAGGQGWGDGPAVEAQFDTPCGVAVDGAFNVYVADTANGSVRRIAPDGVVTTLAADLSRPVGIAVDADRVLYLAGDARVVEIHPGLRTRTVAGSTPGFADGPGADARFRSPAGVAVAAKARLVVTDATNALVRVVSAAAHAGLRLPSSPLIDPSFDADSFDRHPLWWPFNPPEGPFEVTGTMGEARGGTGGERFHAGLDVSGDEGMTVFALRDGVVASPLALTAFGTTSESIRIGPIAYVHLRVGRRRERGEIDLSKFVPAYDVAGRVAGMRVKRGARFRTGDPVGTLNTFNHAHINVGWPGEEHNPLRFRLPQFEDTIPPTIAAAGVRLFAEDGGPLTHRLRGRITVHGRVQIVVDAWDQADGNEPRRRLGLYALGYQVLHADGTPAPGFEVPRDTILFDRLADDGVAHVVFAPGSGIPYYGTRRTRFLYIVTNTFRHGVASHGSWDTAALPAGDYILRIVAADIRGNLAVRNRDLPVTIAGAN